MIHQSTIAVLISKVDMRGVPSTNVIDEEHRHNTECDTDDGANDTEKEGITVSLLFVEECTVLTEECLSCELLTQHCADSDSCSDTISTGKHFLPRRLFLIRLDLLHKGKFAFQGSRIRSRMSTKSR